MPQTFKFSEIDRTDVGWFFIASITGVPKDHPLWSTKPNFEVELKVNGEEVPFIQGITRMMENMDDMVEKRAVTLLKERAGGLLDKITTLTDEVYEQVLSEGRRLFPDVDFDRR